MNHYAYRVYRTLTNPIFVGTVTAKSMDDAVLRIMTQNKIEAVKEHDYVSTEHHYFVLKGEKVGILVYANPEDFS